MSSQVGRLYEAFRSSAAGWYVARSGTPSKSCQSPRSLPIGVVQLSSVCAATRPSATTKDGWIYLMCNKEKFWGTLCEKIGRAEWADDARFSHFPDRFENRDLLTEMLDQALSAQTTEEWMSTFAGAKIPRCTI